MGMKKYKIFCLIEDKDRSSADEFSFSRQKKRILNTLIISKIKK